MVSTTVARNIIGIIGNVVSFFLFASPITTFIKIWKSKSVEEFKPDPYIATIMNCALWVVYGLPIVHPDSILVVTINGIGLAMELVYITIFFIYANKKGRLKVIGWIFVELVCFAILVICTLLLRHTHEQRSQVIGILGIIFGSLMYAFAVMQNVIKTKSVQYLPFYLSLTCFLNGAIWVTFALLRFDLYLLIPNGLGALFGAMQLILYACYFKSTPKYNDERPSELQLSTQNARAAV